MAKPTHQLTSPCSRCTKQVTTGYGSVLSGTFVCEECLLASPNLIAQLSDEALAKLRAKGKLK